MVLVGIQKELVDGIGAMVTNGNVSALDKARLNRIKASLAEYCMHSSAILRRYFGLWVAILANRHQIYSGQAVRDWDFMVDYAAKAGSNLSKDPFLLSSEKRLSNE